MNVLVCPILAGCEKKTKKNYTSNKVHIQPWDTTDVMVDIVHCGMRCVELVHIIAPLFRCFLHTTAHRSRHFQNLKTFRPFPFARHFDRLKSHPDRIRRQKTEMLIVIMLFE